MGEARKRSKKRGTNEPKPAFNDSPFDYPPTFSPQDYEHLRRKVYTPEVISYALTLPVEVMQDDAEPTPTRMLGAREVREAIYGKATEKREHSGAVKIEVICDGE